MMKLGLGLLFIAGFSSVAMGQVWNDSTEIVGAVAQGRGGTAIAVSGELDIVWSNPAGLALLASMQVTLGGESYSQSSDSCHAWRFIQGPDSYTEIVNDPDRMEADHNQFGHLSVGWPFKVAGRPAALWLGYRRALGFPAQAAEWTEATTVVVSDSVSGPWTVNYRSTIDYSGGVDDWGAAIAMEVLPRLRAGVLIHILDADVDTLGLHTKEGTGLLGQSTYAYQFSGTAWTAGLQYDLGGGWTAGAAYRAGIDADYHYALQSIASQTRESHGTSTLHWPDGWGAGLSWHPVKPLLVAIDYSTTSWAEAYVDEVEYPTGYIWDSQAYPSMWSTADQMDTSVWRLGTEYDFPASGMVGWTVRAGYFRQDQVMNWATLPYLNKTTGEQPVLAGWSIGVGAAWNKMRFDAAYVWGSWTERALAANESSPGRTAVPALDGRVDAEMHRFLISATLILD